MSGLKMLKMVQDFRRFDPDIQSQTMAIFFYVAIHSKGKFSDTGVPMTAIADDLDMAQSSVSRNISILTKEDPMERRRKLVRLTNRGQRFYDSVNN
jgi:DNA-binding MarR family transcriptional regulator